MTLGGGWLWLRGSSLVSVDHVTVTGVQGPSARRIRAALESAARNMTTLDVNVSALRVAVAAFPVVKSISVSTQFPHGMRIQVFEQVPVGAVTVGGRKFAVTANGILLPSVNASGLASIPVSVPPGGTRVTGTALSAAALLGAAPGWLRGRVTQVSTTAANGLVAALRNGPEIYFGDAGKLHAKWAAAAAVLADASSQGAAYIDVSVPERPAAGGVVGAATSTQPSSLGASPSSTTTTATTPATGATGATGNTGASGNTGATGTTGATGATGNTGAVAPTTPVTGGP
jgi:cell division septal protein FtsQ